jgi:hypothetical protein
LRSSTSRAAPGPRHPSFHFSPGEERHGNFERKFKDPDGVLFDISEYG